jgi:predicted nucleotidyltransferase
MNLTILQQEIFSLLCKRVGTKTNQRQLAKLLKATPTGVAQALKEMKKAELVSIEKSDTMNLNLVSLNRDQQTMQLKRVENLRQLYETGFVDFLEEKYPGTTIILFGSYSTGEDTTKSDIDIAVIGGKKKKMDLTKFEKTFEKAININFYESIVFIQKELRENLCNGILLAGFIQL